jgi:hypothetical protein
VANLALDLENTLIMEDRYQQGHRRVRIQVQQKSHPGRAPVDDFGCYVEFVPILTDSSHQHRHFEYVA